MKTSKSSEILVAGGTADEIEIRLQVSAQDLDLLAGNRTFNLRVTADAPATGGFASGAIDIGTKEFRFPDRGAHE